MGHGHRSSTAAMAVGIAVMAMLAGACSLPGSAAGVTQPTIATVAPIECEPGDGVDELLVPRCGVLLGSIDPPTAASVPLSLDHQETVVAASTEPGVPFGFDLVRVYQRGTPGAIAQLEARLAESGDAAGRLVFFSWKVDTGPGAWASVAAGDHDDTLVAFADAVAAGGQTIFLSLHHEPEGDPEGRATDFVAMWQHAHEVVEAALAGADGGGDVVWVVNYMGHVDGEDLVAVDRFYPGNAYVDWISYNPYNWAVCRNGARWRDFADVAMPLYRHFTTEELYLDDDGVAKPLMIGETGTNEDPDDPARKAEWFEDMAGALEGGKLPQIKAVVYFNQAAPTFCDRYWDSSPAAAAAFIDLATHPFFNPLGASIDDPAG